MEEAGCPLERVASALRRGGDRVPFHGMFAEVNSIAVIFRTSPMSEHWSPDWTRDAAGNSMLRIGSKQVANDTEGPVVEGETRKGQAMLRNLAGASYIERLDTNSVAWTQGGVIPGTSVDRQNKATCRCQLGLIAADISRRASECLGEELR